MKYLKMAWQYLYNLAVAYDLLMNAMLGGDPRETISHRIARARKSRPRNLFFYMMKWGINGLFMLVGEMDHIEKQARGKTRAKEVWDWNKK